MYLWLVMLEYLSRVSCISTYLNCRGGEEDDDKDREELEAAFTALEEKVLDQYTYAKVNDKIILHLLVYLTGYNWYMHTNYKWAY